MFLSFNNLSIRHILGQNFQYLLKLPSSIYFHLHIYHHINYQFFIESPYQYF